MAIILVLKSDRSTIYCERTGHHARPRERAGGTYLEFNAKEDEWNYWKNLPFHQKQSINKAHLETGKCVLCMLDEHLLVA